MNNYKLYVMGPCPYCQKVVNYVKENNIDIDILDVHDPANKEDLVRLGGKFQAPALRIGDKIMYESDDIIKYMEANF